MILSFTENSHFDIDLFWRYLPYKDDDSSYVELSFGGYQLDLDNRKTFSHLDVVTWALNDYFVRSPERIEFDYGDIHTNITVVFNTCFFTFTFFDNE